MKVVLLVSDMHLGLFVKLYSYLPLLTKITSKMVTRLSLAMQLHILFVILNGKTKCKPKNIYKNVCEGICHMPHMTYLQNLV